VSVELLSGKVAELRKYSHELEAKLKAATTREGLLREFVEKVASQPVSRPDYWCSCGQCESNTDDAKMLIIDLKQQ